MLAEPSPLVTAKALSDVSNAPLTQPFRTDGVFWRKLATYAAQRAPAAVARYVPSLCGFAFAAALPAVRARVRSNLRRLHGERAYGVETRDVLLTFAHFASCLTDALALGGPNPPTIDFQVSGSEHLQSVVARGRGVVIVTAHTGGWETAGPLLKQRFGLDVMIAMQGERDERARAVSDAARIRAGIKVAHVGDEPLSVLPLYAHLRAGGVLGVQVDRVPHGMRAIDVNFLGRPSKLPSGPFELARATGAAILPVFAHRAGHRRYDVTLDEPILVERKATAEEITHAAQTVACEMARFFRAHPTHWFDFGA